MEPLGAMVARSPEAGGSSFSSSTLPSHSCTCTQAPRHPDPRLNTQLDWTARRSGSSCWLVRYAVSGGGLSTSDAVPPGGIPCRTLVQVPSTRPIESNDMCKRPCSSITTIRRNPLLAGLGCGLRGLITVRALPSHLRSRRCVMETSRGSGGTPLQGHTSSPAAI